MSENNNEKRTRSRKSKYQLMRWVIKQAEHGDLFAQHQAGALFATGNWDGPKDLAEAVKWYTRAAEAGHAISQYDLGFMLLLGEGTEKDIPKGMWWLEQAVLNGESSAAHLLADIYRDGLFGIEPDAEAAARWSEKTEKLK